MDDDRKIICGVISEMLDNPDECGIYPTGIAYDKIEAHCANLRAELKAANARTKKLEGALHSYVSDDDCLYIEGYDGDRVLAVCGEPNCRRCAGVAALRGGEGE